MDGGNTLAALKSLLDSQRAPWDLPEQKDVAKKGYTDLKLKTAKLSLEAQGKAKMYEAEKMPELQLRIDENEQKAGELLKLLPKKKLHKVAPGMEQSDSDGSAPDEKTLDPKVLADAQTKLDKLAEDRVALDSEMYDIRREIERLYDASSREICDHGHCYLQKLKDGSPGMADLSGMELISEDVSHFKSLDGPGMYGNEKTCGSAENKKAVEIVMRNLCLGVPVTTGVSDAKVKIKGEHQKSWSSRSLGGHAMIITGVKMIEGKPHFIFRNSWGKSGAGTATDFDNACRLEFSGAVVNRTTITGESMSEAKAWVYSTMGVPKDDNGKAARDFYKNRVGKLIKITEADNSVVEPSTEKGINIHGSLDDEAKQK